MPGKRTAGFVPFRADEFNACLKMRMRPDSGSGMGRKWGWDGRSSTSYLGPRKLIAHFVAFSCPAGSVTFFL